MSWIQQLDSAKWGGASATLLSAYLLGCLTTGYYLVRLRRGADIRTLGSGNVGARNVGRVLGWPGFSLTLVGDFTKGALAVLLARHFTQDHTLRAVAMLAVVAGHLWPVQLRFQGGKGVATSLGALLAFDAHLAVAFGLCFGVGWLLCRKTVLSGLFAFICLPVLSLYLGNEPAQARESYTIALSLAVLAGLVLIAHHKNIAQELSLSSAQCSPSNQEPPKS